MTADAIKKRILEFASHVAFEYNGKPCGVDPYNIHSFSLWCGNATVDVSSIDDVMNTRFFDGKSLSEISDKITEIEG